MGLTKTVLKRPVTVVMVVLCLIVFGLQSVLNAKLELTPSMEMPMLIISTIYPGASPEDVTELVTKEIENDLGSLSGVDQLYSYSLENVSLVGVKYDYGVDLDEAYDDLKKKTDALVSELPDECEIPVIVEMDIEEQASITLAVNHKGTGNLYDYVDSQVVPKLERLTGVSEVDISGGQEEYIQIKLIPEKMEQYRLTMSGIASSVASADFTYPAGDTEMGRQMLSVSAETEYQTVEMLKKIPISLGNGNVIYLEDIADVGTTLDQATGIARYNGEDTISVGIKKQQSATAVEISNRVHELIDEMMSEDDNLEIAVVEDMSDKIVTALKTVLETMILAVIISMVVIYLFFGEIKASLIVGTSIPLSILAALVLMQTMGFSMNVITLGSLVLGVGMMVDNSIVVLESCFRFTKGKENEAFYEAALAGTGEVLSSVVSSTLTNCVVFLPLALLAGLSGQLFKPLGFTIIFCMTASLISAVTIVPLCYYTYRPVEKERSPLSKTVQKLQNGYRNLMASLLPKRKLVITTSVGLLILSLLLATQLGVELMMSDTSDEVAITIETRPGLKVAEVDKILQVVEQTVTQDEDVESYLLTYGGSGISISSSGAALTAYLKDDCKRSVDEVIDDWKMQLKDIRDVNISMEAASSLSALMSEEDLEIILRGTDLDELKAVSDEIEMELLERSDVTKIHSTLENAAPVVKLSIDAMKANAENITPLQVASSVNSMIDGIEATTLEVDGEEISVYVEYPKEKYNSIDELQGIVLTNNLGNAVALTDVAEMGFKDSPANILRKDKQFEVTITGDMLTKNDREKEAIEEQIFEEVVSKHLSSSIVQAQGTIDERMTEEFSALGGAIATAVFLVFVVMAAQFESVRFSVMVMTTIPFSLIGAFGLLYLVDSPISMVSLLGFLMMSGTVVNNGILYVDTVNSFLKTMSREEALIEAGVTRMRPILMTTLTTVVAMLPLCFGIGDSGEMLQGLALVNVGGLVASTILALLMLPAYYDLISRK